MSISYMEYGKCVSCKFWKRWELKPCFGRCTSDYARSFSNVNFYEEAANYSVTSEPLITGERFGCIHWRQNDEWGRR